MRRPQACQGRLALPPGGFTRIWPGRFEDAIGEVTRPLFRYFLAVTPPEPTRSQIEAFRGRWGHPHHRVEPHITLKAPFEWSGEPRTFLEPVYAACAKVAPFTVTPGRPDRFAGGKVLYLNVSDMGLAGLHKAVADALTGRIAPDRQGHEGDHYTPHMTLASTRFGISPEGMDQMEQEALQQLCGLPPFSVTSARCYHWNTSMGRWQTHCDVPLGNEDLS